MSKFEKGDEVIVVKGLSAGKRGIVEDPWWQIAANDWPFVLAVDESGYRFSFDEDEAEARVHGYEYNIQRADGSFLYPSWGEKWMIEDFFAALLEGSAFGTTSVLVRRRKAGEIEYV